jgi:tRNA threonylcarbamoyladenosine biosynthesis protein TsaE
MDTIPIRITSHSPEETAAYARLVAAEVLKKGRDDEGAVVIALAGALGAGKTTFTKAFVAACGVPDTVTSPTFVIEKRYRLSGVAFDLLVHIDAYRLESAHELETLGFRSLVTDSSNLILLEWPEKVSEIIPQTARWIRFAHVNEMERAITYG